MSEAVNEFTQDEVQDCLEFQYKDAKIKVVVIDNKPWFVATGVRRALGVHNTYQLFERVHGESKCALECLVNNVLRRRLAFNSAGLMELFSTSRKPESYSFRQWVLETLFPVLRDKGFIINENCSVYSTSNVDEDCDYVENTPCDTDENPVNSKSIKVFQHGTFGDIQVVMIDDEPWFVADSVCRALDIINSRDALTRLDDDEKGVATTDTIRGKQLKNIVSEAGLYSLILTSRKPEAKQFKRWITHEVIPSIRKHGLYAVEELLNNPDMLIGALTALKEERAKVAERDARIAEIEPKAEYTEQVLDTPDLIPITKIAKEYGMTAQQLNEFLEEKKIQYKCDNGWVLADKYARLGYAKSKTFTFKDKKGETHSVMHLYWTQAGRYFIHTVLMDSGIVPIQEHSTGDLFVNMN